MGIVLFRYITQPFRNIGTVAIIRDARHISHNLLIPIWKPITPMRRTRAGQSTTKSPIVGNCMRWSTFSEERGAVWCRVLVHCDSDLATDQSKVQFIATARRTSQFHDPRLHGGSCGCAFSVPANLQIQQGTRGHVENLTRRRTHRHRGLCSLVRVVARSG